MAQQNPPENYLGTWKAVTGAQEKIPPMLILWGKDSITIRQDTLWLTSAYSLECAADSCILNIVGGKIPKGVFIITPVDRNAFYFNTLENHRQYLEAKNATPGAIAWGWSDPRPIRFERQQERP